MYASLRTYRIGSGSVDAVMRRVDRDFAEALSQEPGFLAYHAIDTDNDMVMTISLFHDREQAQASGGQGSATIVIGDGFTIEGNHAADRVQIFLDDKPDDEMRTEGAWQRKLTDAAIASARHLLGADAAIDRRGRVVITESFALPASCL